MLRAITSFDVLLVEDFDRLGLRVARLADVLEALSETGTHVATPAWGPSAEPVPFQVLLFLAVVAQGARNDVSRRTRAGMAPERARRSGRQ